MRFGGAGAGARYYPADAELYFLHDGGTLQDVSTTVFIAEPPHNQRIESVLGRDVLDHFVMRFEQRAQRVTLEALSHSTEP